MPSPWESLDGCTIRFGRCFLFTMAVPRARTNMVARMTGSHDAVSESTCRSGCPGRCGLGYRRADERERPRPYCRSSTPRSIARLSQADLRERFAAMSVEIVGGPRGAFARYIGSELKRWGEV